MKYFLKINIILSFILFISCELNFPFNNFNDNNFFYNWFLNNGYFNNYFFQNNINLDTADEASKSLDDVEEKILEKNISDFVTEKERKKKELQDKLKSNDEDINKIISLSEKNIKDEKIKNGLRQWLNIKMNQNKIIKQELKQYDDLLMVLTKLEAAKYFAKSHVKDVKDLEGNNEQSYSTQLKNNDDNLYDKKMNNFNYKNNVLGSKKNTLKNTNDSDHSTKQSKQIKNNKEKILQSVDYIEKILNADSLSVSKLLFKIKTLLNEEISEKEKIIDNNKKLKKLDEYLSRRNLVSKFEKNNIDSEGLLKDINEAKERLWWIKEVEWKLTQLETLKYFVKIKQTYPDDKIFVENLNHLIEQ